jgi:hypothetical protein
MGSQAKRLLRLHGGAASFAAMRVEKEKIIWMRHQYKEIKYVR